MPEIPNVGPVEHKLLGMLLGVTQKSFSGQINLESTELTEITFVVCFFPCLHRPPIGHLN